MKFNDFLEILPLLEKEPLVPLESHTKMAPLERVKYYQNYDYSVHNPKKAAVVTLFYPRENQTKLLLIIRSTYPGVHSSQIAFPGGKQEYADRDLKHTAWRELEEEVGVRQDEVKIIKQWSELYIPPSNFLVTPFLGVTMHTPLWSIQEEEVAGIIELDLEELLKDQLVQNVLMSTSYIKEIEVPAFVIEKNIVWGATAMMLSEVKETLKKVLQKN